MNIYSIRDDAAQYFLPPFYAKTDNQAKRMFIGSLGDSFPHRSDFNLFLIGAFDDDKGVVSPCDPTCVLHGLSISADLSPSLSSSSPQQSEPLQTDPPFPPTNESNNKDKSL